MPVSLLKRFSEKGGFARSVGILAAGSSAGHVVTAATMPLLSRLYSPADFGTLSLFTSATVVVTVAACLRFDVAIALPPDEKTAICLLTLAIGSAGMVSLALGLALWAIGPAQLNPLVGSALTDLWIWIPFTIFIAAVGAALQNWNIRNSAFTATATAKLVQATLTSTTQTLLGWLSFGAWGLILGALAGFLANALVLTKSLLAIPRNSITAIKPARIFATAKEYRRFPVYSTWEALLNASAMYVPLILIGSMGSVETVGYIMLAMYTIQAPLVLLGTAVAQVYLSKAAESYREGNLAGLTLRVLSGLMKIGLPALAAISVAAPLAFPLIFGPAWSISGWLVLWMMPWFIFQFLSTPLSMAMSVIGKQRTALSLQAFALAVRVSAVTLAALHAPNFLAEAYAASGAAVYAVTLWMIIRASGVPARNVITAISRAIPNTIAAVLVSLLSVTAVSILTR